MTNHISRYYQLRIYEIIERKAKVTGYTREVWQKITRIRLTPFMEPNVTGYEPAITTKEVEDGR